MNGSAERIYALVMRHIYIWRSSIMRLVDSIYWPAVQMVMWGFMTQYLLPQASFVAQAAGVLLSGLLLWEVVVRCNLSLSIAFLEEMWSRNLGHLFVSPIRSISTIAPGTCRYSTGPRSRAGSVILLSGESRMVRW